MGKRSDKADQSTKARKRYYRSAERNLKRSAEATGAAAARYRELAKTDFERALATYSRGNKQRFSEPIQRLANEFGVDLESRRRDIDRRVVSQATAISESQYALEGAKEDPDIRREREARAILSNSKIGSRIIGGLVDVWRDKALITDESGAPIVFRSGKTKVDTSKILPALLEYFGTDSVADMLARIESVVGEALYTAPDSEWMYHVIKLQLQTKVIENTLVQ